MKKIITVLLLLAWIIPLAAEGQKMSAGLGLEWNMNSRHNFAGGTFFNFDYQLPRFASLGFSLGVNSNFDNIHIIEPVFLFRAYRAEDEFAGLFFQSELGASFIFEDEELTRRPRIGFGTGYRILLGSSFFVEPYGRIGYPFAFSLGVAGGIRF